MTRLRALLLIGVALGALAWVLWPVDMKRAPEPSPPGRTTSEATAAPVPGGSPGSNRVEASSRPSSRPLAATLGDDAGDDEVAEIHGHELATTTTLVEYLARAPVSPVPHRVLRGWGGAPGRQGGSVGLFVVVDPHLPSSELEQLAEDLRDGFDGADGLAARVYDDETAVTYDRHSDGGELAKRHLVAEVRFDRVLGVDSIRIRGREMGGRGASSDPR